MASLTGKNPSKCTAHPTMSTKGPAPAVTDVWTFMPGSSGRPDVAQAGLSGGEPPRLNSTDRSVAVPTLMIGVRETPRWNRGSYLVRVGA